MESMKDIKEWLVQKCRMLHGGNSHAENQLKSNELPGGITPKTIPDFVIPGSGETSRRTSSELGMFEDNISRRSSSQRSSIASCKSSPRTSINGSLFGLSVPKSSDICRSAPVSPKHEIKSIAYDDNSQSMEYLESISSTTNADPLSMAAISLPHFRTKTSYGFMTLTQSPHTRRKESLFHTGSDNLLTQSERGRKMTLEALKVRCKSEVLNDIARLEFETFQKSRMSVTPFVVVTPSSNINNNFPKNDRVYGGNMSPTQRSNNLQVCGRRDKYYRRRSSLLGLEDSSISTEDSASDQISDEKRQSSTNLHPGRRSASPKRHSSPQLMDESVSDVDQKPRSSSCGSLLKSEIPQLKFLAEHGEIKFAFHYLPVSKLFKVTILRAENLGDQSKIDQNINSYCKVYLMPGKIQKQTTDMIKHTKNPVFNQELTFHSLNLEQLHSMVLRIKIFHKAHNLKMPEFLGRVDVGLDHYDLTIENRMWKDIDARKEREDIGSIEVSLKFLPRDGSVMVGVKQARGLPHHNITGYPDPYVKIEVFQPNRSVSRKQTKTRKNTSDPTYDEIFNFSISPKMDDLAYTSVTVAVYDHEKIRSDEMIGQVKFGVGSTQDAEMDLWVKCVNTPGVEVSDWLFLVDNDDFK